MVIFAEKIYNKVIKINGRVFMAENPLAYGIILWRCGRGPGTQRTAPPTGVWQGFYECRALNVKGWLLHRRGTACPFNLGGSL